LDRRDDSFRFLGGTHANPAFYACEPGLDIIREVGVARIREKSIRQTGALDRSREGPRLAREHPGRSG